MAAEEPLPEKRQPEEDNSAVGVGEEEEECPQESRPFAVASLQDDVDGELLQPVQ